MRKLLFLLPFLWITGSFAQSIKPAPVPPSSVQFYCGYGGIGGQQFPLDYQTCVYEYTTAAQAVGYPCNGGTVPPTKFEMDIEWTTQSNNHYMGIAYHYEYICQGTVIFNDPTPGVNQGSYSSFLPLVCTNGSLSGPPDSHGSPTCYCPDVTIWGLNIGQWWSDGWQSCLPDTDNVYFGVSAPPIIPPNGDGE